MTAPEPTPRDAVARALYEEESGLDRLWDDAQLRMRGLYLGYANAATTALLAGDWLERVLGEHGEASTRLDAWVCASCGAALNVISPGPGTLEGRVTAGVIAHQAAAVRTAAGVGL